MLIRSRLLVAAAAIALSSMLAGCVDPAEQARSDAAACEAYGFRPGTDAYANCLMTRDRDRRNAESDALQSLSNSLGQMGQPASTSYCSGGSNSFTCQTYH